MGAMHTNQQEVDHWEYFRKKTNDLRNIAKQHRDLSSDEKEAVFIQRAKSLQQEKRKGTAQKDFLKVISFHVGGELFGIEVKHLQEVYEANRIVRIPCTPSVLVGLINYRGTVLTIIDLSILFDIEKEPEHDPARPQEERHRPVEHKPHIILIVEYSGKRAGIIIDKLDNIIELPAKHIQPVSSFFQNNSKIVKSEAQWKDKPLLLIDPEALLCDERLYINEVV